MPNSFPILVGGASAVARSTAKLMKTGQATSYRTGDDGDLEAGRDVDLFTLAENNPFGNTNRFTGTTGGYQTILYYDKYGIETTRELAIPDEIVVDWSTFDGSTVLGWYNNISLLQIWEDAVDNAKATSIGIYTTGWKLPNITELFSLIIWEGVSPILNYPPFNMVGNVARNWTSTNISASARFIDFSSLAISILAKTTSCRYVACRYFTVNGTTLT